MTELKNGTTGRGRGHANGRRSAGARIAAIWDDITYGQRRAYEINRPWVTGRTPHSR